MRVDPFSIEEQVRRAREGLKAKTRPVAKLAQNYASELDRHRKNEAKLRRAYNAWDKSRRTVLRLEKRLDKLEAE